MKLQAIVIDGKDNVATIVGGTLKKGASIRTQVGKKGVPLTARAEIPPGHKVAVAPITKGEEVIKYGESIGSATREIAKGDHVHVHNIESNRGRGDLIGRQ